MDVEQVTDITERILEGGRRCEWINVEVECQDPLALVLMRPQPEYHQASVRRIPVAELGDVPDQVPSHSLRTHGFGLSSIA